MITYKHFTCVKGKVIGFFDSWPAKRKFPVDMAGFAIHVQLLFQYPYATMPYKAGFEEDRFLTALSIKLDDIEPKANNCTRVCNTIYCFFLFFVIYTVIFILYLKLILVN